MSAPVPMDTSSDAAIAEQFREESELAGFMMDVRPVAADDEEYDPSPPPPDSPGPPPDSPKDEKKPAVFGKASRAPSFAS
jgi:hypothetical protein